MQPRHTAPRQRYAQQRLLLAHWMRQYKPLEPTQRVHIKNRLDAGVREVRRPRHLKTLQAGRLLKDVVEGRVLCVRVLNQEQIDELESRQRFLAGNLMGRQRRQRRPSVDNAKLLEGGTGQGQLINRHVKVDCLQLEAGQLRPHAGQHVRQEAGVGEAAQFEAADVAEVGRLEVGQVGEPRPHAELFQLGQGLEDSVEEQGLAHREEEAAEAKGLK